VSVTDFTSIHKYEDVGFEVLTAVVMKSCTFWDVTQCSPLTVNQRLEAQHGQHEAGSKHVGSRLAYSLTLKLEAICSSESSVYFRRTTQRYIPEDRTLRKRRLL
jgi:hypothetical protein